MEELIKTLSAIDEPEIWKDHTNGYDKAEVARAFAEAEVLWLKRMISDHRLFLHPDIIAEIKSQGWKPSDLHKRMIWASIIGSDESRYSKKRMYRIKTALINKHGADWWEDVYARIKPVYAAKERIKMLHSGPAVSMFINKTLIGGEHARSERDEALRMIPRN